MTIRELIQELLKDELKLDDDIRFYYMKEHELIGCEIESIAYRDQVEFTIQDEEELLWHLIKIHLRMKCLYY